MPWYRIVLPLVPSSTHRKLISDFVNVTTSVRPVEGSSVAQPACLYVEVAVDHSIYYLRASMLHDFAALVAEYGGGECDPPDMERLEQLL